MKISNVYYLPSGRIFKFRLDDGFEIESTEMRDVSTAKKIDAEVRNTTDVKTIWKHIVPFEDKWLLTVSTQKGCVHKCKFCDVAPLGFHGNLSTEEILEQVDYILRYTPYVTKSKKVKIGFARMGEPAHNIYNVLEAMKSLPNLSKFYDKQFNWLPCFNTILPKKTILNWSGDKILNEILITKEEVFNGFMHLQISCNSTNEKQRKQLFGGASVIPISEIIKIINSYKITNRTVTLNFIVMENIDINIKELLSMGIDNKKISIKLIPMNQTNEAKSNKLKTYANYASYSKLIKLGKLFSKVGFNVVVDTIAKCEEAGLCCGQLVKL